MTQNFEGGFTGAGHSFAIVVGRFNALFSEQLLDGCIDGLTRHGVADEDIDVVHVPGAMEIPLTCQRLARTEAYDAIIALGAVIRGATPHFEQVTHAVSRGCAEVSLAESTPVVFGVLTTDTLDQAVERSGTKAGNKGFDAALSALEMANLLQLLPDEAGE
jgi:6,7-dimethyl-8-ribityllumazine synthase